MDDYCKRSGQIPAFGDWDYANQLPITQYFECARQAGLTRYSSSSGESDPSIPSDFYALPSASHKRSQNLAPQRTAKRGRERERAAPARIKLKEHKKQGKVCDVTEPPRKHPHQGDVVPPPKRAPTRPRPKPVDEDLYKIPPELLRSSNRRKPPRFFSCLVPACAS